MVQNFQQVSTEYLLYIIYKELTPEVLPYAQDKCRQILEQASNATMKRGFFFH